MFYKLSFGSWVELNFSEEVSIPNPPNCFQKINKTLLSVVNFMDSTSMPHKVLKVGDAVKIMESVDRISSLPDAILCHVLSFLPTKYAVGTSILSTRWRYLFASIPSLDFDDSLRVCRQKAVKVSTFMNFVERVLILRDITYVDRFRLKCGQNVDASRVNIWICVALQRNVRELDLFIAVKEFNKLPSHLFTHEMLTSLKLGAKFVLNVPTTVCLPNLKIILLDKIEFFDDNSIRRLISSCPVLEDLVILGCGWNNIRIFNISAPALKSLTIDCLAGNGYSTEFCEYEIVLNAPNLVYLKYIDFVPEGFSVKNLQSLVKAHIDVGFSSQQFEDSNYHYFGAISDILGAFSKVQSLHFSGDFLEAIGLNFHRYALPTCYETTWVELGCTELGRLDYPVGWKMLPELLDRWPCLESLVFYEGLLQIENEDNYRWYPPSLVPSCLSSHLKTIEIATFRGHSNELGIVRYFLKNSSVLENMKIHTDQMTQMNVSKKLLKFPRGSTACKVTFSLH